MVVPELKSNFELKQVPYNTVLKILSKYTPLWFAEKKIGYFEKLTPSHN